MESFVQSNEMEWNRSSALLVERLTFADCKKIVPKALLYKRTQWPHKESVLSNGIDRSFVLETDVCGIVKR
jgi:hypothetical protein